MERNLLACLSRLSDGAFRHVVILQRHAGALAAALPDGVAALPLNLPQRSRTAGLRLAATLADLQPAILHARNPGAWWDALLAGTGLPGTRLILGFYGFDHAHPPGLRSRWLLRLGRLAGATLLTNAFSAQGRLARWAGWPNAEIRVIPNGVDPALFSRPDEDRRRVVRQSLGLGQADFVIGTVGRLAPVKRPEWLLEVFEKAAAQAPASHLVFVGDGSLREGLIAKAAMAGLARRVHVIGQRPDVAELLAAFDLFALGSASEAHCTALLEAMAAGLPCLATNVGDNALLLEEGFAGVLVDPEDERAMEFALLRLMGDAVERRVLSERARKRAEHYTVDAMAHAHEEFYSDLMSGKRHAPSRIGPEGGCCVPTLAGMPSNA